MRMKASVDIEALRCELSYDADTGSFNWIKSGRGKTKRAGGKAGRLRKDGYVIIKVSGVDYFAHRIAIAFALGEWPAFEIDHVNGNKSDNRFVNLRCASTAQNRWNTAGWCPSKRKHVAHKGVSFDARRGVWIARITHHGKTTWLGSFGSEKNAAAAYLGAELALRPDFRRGAEHGVEWSEPMERAA